MTRALPFLLVSVALLQILGGCNSKSKCARLWRRAHDCVKWHWQEEDFLKTCQNERNSLSPLFACLEKHDCATFDTCVRQVLDDNDWKSKIEWSTKSTDGRFPSYSLQYCRQNVGETLGVVRTDRCARTARIAMKDLRDLVVGALGPQPPLDNSHASAAVRLCMEMGHVRRFLTASERRELSFLRDTLLELDPTLFVNLCESLLSALQDDWTTAVCQNIHSKAADALLKKIRNLRRHTVLSHHTYCAQLKHLHSRLEPPQQLESDVACRELDLAERFIRDDEAFDHRLRDGGSIIYLPPLCSEETSDKRASTLETPFARRLRSEIHDVCFSHMAPSLLQLDHQRSKNRCGISSLHLLGGLKRRGISNSVLEPWFRRCGAQLRSP